MRHPWVVALAAIALATSGTARAADVRVGLAAPLSDTMAILGGQLRAGAELAARAANAELVIVDDRCTADGGALAAREFVRQDVQAVVGFLCTEAIEAALPILTEAGIPVITSGVRSDGLTDRHVRTGWLVWRIAPRADAERAAAASILTRLWRDDLFAIVDDGTIYGRELSESLRLAVETAGLKPVFFDTYRPQSENQIGLVGRLRRSGATHVFVGGDRDDVGIMARDAAGLDYPLTIAGGEALRSAGDVPLAEGTLMIATPEWAEMLDEGTVAMFDAEGIIPEGYVVPSYASVEVALQAIEQAAAGSDSIAATLRDGSFQTLLGEISFDEKGDLTTNPFQLLRFDGERFLPTE
jgi:branched-chain amino acid transport system substrate-binding protein